MLPKIQPDWTSDIIRVQTLPVLAVEIVSPSQSTQQLVDTAQRYLQAGIPSAWVIEMPLKLVAVYTEQGGSQVFTNGEIVDPTNEFQIQIDELFR